METLLDGGVLKVRAGLKSYRRRQREGVITFLREVVDTLPGRNELASLEQFKHIKLPQMLAHESTIEHLYADAALAYVKRRYSRFNANRIGDGSRPSSVYDKIHHLILGIPKEDIGAAIMDAS